MLASPDPCGIALHQLNLQRRSPTAFIPITEVRGFLLAFGDEVEEILFYKPYVRRAKKGNVQGENVYVAYNKTYRGRYLVVFFIYKNNRAALPISARDMTQKERRYYEQQKPKY